MKQAAVWVLFGASLLGCATGTTVPTDRLTSSQSAIRAAQEVGAEGLPEAQLHLQLAREQVSEARRLITEGEGERARLLLTRAEADAELAVALAREHAAQMEARQALSEVRAIQERLR